MSNPLSKYFRQPKIFIKLPSSGNFYPKKALAVTEDGQYPVYPMTAKDELLIRTPDALLNGQTTVEVIQSCMPNIKDAWAIPSIDIDAILVAIRIATYGEMLDVTTVIPGLNEKKTYVADLRVTLDYLTNTTFDPEVVINDEITAYVRPLSYREFTNNSIKTLEEQRIVKVLDSDQLDDAQKLALFTTSFKKLTNITVDMVNHGVERIVTPETTVVNPAYIKEFTENADKDFFTKIVAHLEQQKKKFSIQPFKVATTEEEQEAGAPAELSIPITLDSSTFFA